MTDWTKGFHLLKAGAMMVILMLPCAGVLAGSDSLVVNISGTITENTCTVNNSESVKVEFGTVRISTLTSASADVPVNITCDSEPTDTLSLSLNGTASGAGTSALQTDVSGLGVQFYSPSGTLMKLNTSTALSEWKGSTTQTGSFNLKAKLVQQSGVTLSSGEFNASATLVLTMG